MARAILAAALAVALAGCDVIVVGLLASRSKKSSSSSGPAAPDTTYKVYVRSLGATAGDLDNEKIALDGAGGVPGAGWTFVGSATATEDFDITALPGGPFNSILVQAPEAEDYHVDAIEIFNASGVVIETAADASTRGDAVMTPQKAQAASTPDGITVDSDSTPGSQSYLFARFAGPVTLFRLNLWGAARASGDAEWVRTYSSPGNQIVGGAAAKANGTYYVTHSEEAPRSVVMRTIPSDGGTPALSSLELGVTTTLGSQSVAISGDNVYVATTFDAGDIRVRKFEGSGVMWPAVAFTGAGVDRVEANGLTVDGAGNLVVAGGFDFGLPSGFGHFMQRINGAAGGTMWGGSPSPPADSNDTYWYAVTASGTNVYSSGDLFNIDLPLASSIKAYTRLSDAAASGAEVVSSFEAGPDTQADVGRAIGTDSVGSVYVAGSYGGAGSNLNAFLRKYPAGLGSSIPLLESSAAGNDEILDIAVEGDGTVYAVGYETVASPDQDENLFLVKFAPNGAVLWRRTLDGTFGNDRGVSVSTTGTHVYVAGQITVSGGTSDVHVRKYVR